MADREPLHVTAWRDVTGTRRRNASRDVSISVSIDEKAPPFLGPAKEGNSATIWCPPAKGHNSSPAICWPGLFFFASAKGDNSSAIWWPPFCKLLALALPGGEGVDDGVSKSASRPHRHRSKLGDPRHDCCCRRVSSLFLPELFWVRGFERFSCADSYLGVCGCECCRA